MRKKHYDIRDAQGVVGVTSEAREASSELCPGQGQVADILVQWRVTQPKLTRCSPVRRETFWLEASVPTITELSKANKLDLMFFNQNIKKK